MSVDEGVAAAVRAVRDLSLSIGIPQRLHEIGVKEEDGVYYWAQTIDGKTTILEVDGQKLRVTAEVTPPGCRSTKRVTGWRAMTAEIRGSGSRMPRASR
mgnify:CR=1 FL=1